MKHDMAGQRIDGSAQFVISSMLLCHVRLLAWTIATARHLCALVAIQLYCQIDHLRIE